MLKTSKLVKICLPISMFLVLAGCSEKNEILQNQPDMYKAKIIEIHGEKHVDEYHWIRGNSPKAPPTNEVTKLIDTENKKHTEFFDNIESDLIDIYTEISSYENNSFNLPTVHDHFTVIPEKNSDEEFFSIYAVPKDGSQRILLFDQNERAKGLERYEFASMRISPSGKYVAWLEYIGKEEQEVFQIKSIYGEQEIIYKDASNRVNYFEFGQTDDVIYQYHWKSLHRLNPFTKELELLIAEDKENRAVGSLSKSSDGKYLFKTWKVNGATEHYIVDLIQPDSTPKKLIPRSHNMYAEINYLDGKFYVLHDDTTKSLQIDSFELTKEGTAPPVNEWKTLFIGNKDGRITNFDVSYKYVYFTERIAGVDQLLRMDIKTKEVEDIDVSNEFPAITFSDENINDFNSGTFRFRMQSYLSPAQVYEINENYGTLSIWKSANVKPLNPDAYKVERHYAASHDDVDVPITIIRKADTPIDGTSPVYLYVYGAYGNGVGPEFPKFALPLIDRGFIYAIAHVRGGNELGYKWYEDGKLMNKRNSIEDFLSVSKWLIDNNYTEKGRISATAESAGGLIIGAAINRHPDWYQAIALQVPFLDTLNALLDVTLPYTKWDWSEFGNPIEEKAVYDYVKSYSPIDNIRKQHYPNILLASAMNDVSSGHWEVMKYMTKLRDYVTNDPVLLVQVRDGGHISGNVNEFYMGFAYQLTFLNWVKNNGK